MTIRKNLPHLVIPLVGVAEAFKSKTAGGSQRQVSTVPDRLSHANTLLSQLAVIEQQAIAASQRQDLPASERGVYIEVVSRPGEPLATDKLERKSIELLSVRKSKGGETTLATLFVPTSARRVFQDVVQGYRDKQSPLSKTGAPLNRPLVEAIAEFRLAQLKELWTDDPAAFPAAGIPYHWETWLRIGTADRFRSASAKIAGIEIGPSGLVFPEATVFRVTATPESMAKLMADTLCISEVKRTTVTADFFINQNPLDQTKWSDELLRRVKFTSEDQSETRICLLDTGVNRAHPLIAPACAPTDCHVVDPKWGSGDDHEGHGTELAGLALLGDLTELLQGGHTVTIPHRLESVKVIPPKGHNPYDLLGSITRDAVEVAETFGGEKQRVFCIATTTSDDEGHFGRPTSWAAEIDQLAAGVGQTEAAPRLLCLSAGNVREPTGQRPKVDTYHLRNDAAEIEAPAQAWNAITVGAVTGKTVMTSPSLKGYTPFAPKGDISPNSRTASWDGEWPVKPDFVLEGGNLAVEPKTGEGWTVPDLLLLTTSHNYPAPSFSLTADTSAATAQAARLAALTSHRYPDLWPETIRGLLVASADWTPAMLRHLPKKPKKSDFVALLKRYGHGVPNFDRAVYSAGNVLTLIVQDDLQPYSWSKDSTALNEMKLFPLPWPKAALESIPTHTVRMRVALSYFVEPNPSEAQRGRKLRYASHGLRFRVRLPDESDDDFRKRINKAALAADEKVSASDSAGWIIGSDNREVGSIHCDTWVGHASDLARRSSIAIFPVGGWWKERSHLNRWMKRARFSLVVTIDAGETDIDVYTPVETAIAAIVEAQVTVVDIPTG